MRVTYDARAPRAVRDLARALRAADRQHRALRDRDARPPGDAPTMFDRLTPVARVECVSLFAPWLDAHGDGFLALQAGPRDRVHGAATR